MAILIKKVDFSDDQQSKELLQLLQTYALDPQGGEEALSEFTVNNLIASLQKSPIACSFIAYDEQQPIGLANCFYGFSTFAAKPLLNVHDLVVIEGCRGKGIGTKLLEAVEKEAAMNGCCKVTLEVLQNNTRAQRVYKSAGFAGYNLGEEENNALFWQKKLNS